MNTQVTDFRDFLPKGMTLEYRDSVHQPSIQLARWCAKHLQLDPYLVRYRDEDDNFEIYTQGLGAAFIATWPDPGIVGEPKIFDYKQTRPRKLPPDTKPAELAKGAEVTLHQTPIALAATDGTQL
jgi:hypothetical protein